MPDAEGPWTERQVAQKLHCSVRTVRELVKRREMGSIELSPRNRRVTRRQYDDYIARKEAEAWLESSAKTGSGAAGSGSPRPASVKNIRSGESCGTTPLLGKHEAQRLAELIVKGKSSKGARD